MKKLTAKQVAAVIARNNRRFRRATPAQKRVLVAKDVLERLNGGQFTAYTGHWFYGLDGADQNESVQKLVVAGEPCDGCALGALMMSCTVFNNQETVGNTNESLRWGSILEALENDYQFPNGLRKLFGLNQLRDIENAFERRHPCSAAALFGGRYEADSARLKAIMENIVRNNGKFHP